MENELPKAVKRQLREMVGAAHEAALRQALTKLEEEFGRWQRGEIDPFELTDRIHRFHQGPAREIYKQFGEVRTADLPMLAAYGIAAKLVELDQAPQEVLPYLHAWLDAYETLGVR